MRHVRYYAAPHSVICLSCTFLSSLKLPSGGGCANVLIFAFFPLFSWFPL